MKKKYSSNFKTVSKEIKRLNNKFQEQEKIIIEQEKVIIKQELELTNIKLENKKLEDKNKILIKLCNNNEEQLNNLTKGHKIIFQRYNEFKHSIIYPFYNLTHTVGKTKIGQILQKILK